MRSSRFVGRGEELARLRGFVEAVQDGDPAFVLIGGDAGVGKSRLVEALGVYAGDQGMRVLRGHCFGLGQGGVPFAPIVEVLRTVAREVEPSRLPDLLGPSRRELAPLVPALDVGGRSGPVATSGGGERRVRILPAVVEALERLAKGDGLLLVLEDLHWADQATLELVGYLTKNLVVTPVLVVGTFRSDELHRRHPLLPALGEMLRSPHVARIDLEPFERDEVAAQLEGILGEPPGAELVRAVLERSDGNAFYVEELVAAGVDGSASQLPASLREVLLTRLEQLPEDTRAVLSHLGVAGSRATDRLLATVTGLGEDELGAALRPAIDRQVVVSEDDGRLAFRHALVQEVVVDELLPIERARHHRAVARALEADPELATGGDGNAAAELAYHCYAAREYQRALTYSIEAAERASTQGAPTDALEHYERALELWNEGGKEPEARSLDEVIAAAAEAALAAGSYRRAILHLQTLLDDRKEEMDRVDEAILRSRLVVAYAKAGRDDDALSEAERAHDLITATDPAAARAAVALEYARVLRSSVHRDPGEAIEPARAALTAARESGESRKECRALAVLGTALAWTGNPEEGEASLREAVKLATELDDPDATLAAYGALGMHLYIQDVERDQDRSRQLAEEILAWLQAGGRRWPQSVYVLAFPQYCFLRTGEWDRLEETFQLAERYRPEGLDRLVRLNVRATLRWMQGRIEDAAALIEACRDSGLSARANHDHYPLEAEVLAELGRTDDLRATVEEYLAFEVDASEEAMKLAVLVPLVRVEVDAALAATPADRGELVARADATVERMRDIFARYPQPPGTAVQLETAEAYLRLAEAERSRLFGSDPKLWETANEAVGCVYWQLYTRWRLAESLVSTGRIEEAQELTAAAHERAVEIGAQGIRAQLKELGRTADLHLAGELTDAASLGLTPRESEILALLVQGETNRQIGETLHISPKTASVHVSNLLSKLEVADRHEAATRGRELGLDQPPP